MELIDLFFVTGSAACVLSFRKNSYLGQLAKHGRTAIQIDNWFHLSKNHFLLFYVNAVVIGLFTTFSSPSIIKLVFLVHTIRRLVETKVLLNSKTVMNLIHFSLGMTFYPAVWMILSNARVIGSWVWYVTFAIFFTLQMQVHIAFSRNIDRKKLPDYWLFQYFICPNFTCEIGLYLSLLLLIQTMSAFYMFLFVALNQINAALDRKGAYSASQYAILPGI